MDAIDQEFQELMEDMKKIPPEGQKVIKWMIRNMTYVDKLVDYMLFPEEEMAKRFDEVTQDQDYLLLAMMVYKNAKEHLKEIESTDVMAADA
jgi:hypothetical protein